MIFTMKSPYQNLDASAFWKSAVAEQHPFTINDLYTKRFTIEPDHKIATAGSCFAQHIARNLRKNGFSVVDQEPPPPGMSDETSRKYGYGLYSARYGNIYTPRHLLQLAREALGRFKPSDHIWENNGRWYDAMRPSVEPDGFDRPDLVPLHRSFHLKKVRRVLRSCDVFVFTFGLTEGWLHRASGTTYPTAPGTIAGSYDPAVHAFRNFSFNEVLTDFVDFRSLMKEINPGVRFILSVSPVPLTATVSGVHVLQATTYSKSVLRAVAGELYGMFEDVDYFPSYELVASPFSRGIFFDPNLRSVNEAAVDHVMRVFFSQHRPPETPVETTEEPADGNPDNGDRKRRLKKARKAKGNVVCEDELLEAFSR
jgi:hypothetical protein